MRAWLTLIKRVALFYRSLTLLFFLTFLAICWLLTQAGTSYLHQEGICEGCLYPISLTSQGEGWALPPLYWSEPYLLQKWGDQWQWTALPLNSGHHTIETLSTDASGDVWAIVARSENLTWLLHQHTGKWTILPQTQVFAFIDAFQMLSASDGWLIGDKGNIHFGPDNFFAHFNGSNWQRVPVPSPVAFHAIAFIADDDGWAVGDQGAIIHYTHGQWQGVPSPTTHDLYGIQMLSATNGWAVGDAGVMLHYDGSRWQAITLTQPVNVTLGEIAMISQGEGWATEFTHFSPYGAPRLWHFQNNMWLPTKFSDNQRFFAIAMRSATEGWAIGGDFLYPPDDGSRLYGRAILAHYKNGEWHVINAPLLPEPNWILQMSVILRVALIIGLIATSLMIWNISVRARNTLMPPWLILIGLCLLLLSASGQFILLLIDDYAAPSLLITGLIAAISGLLAAIIIGFFPLSGNTTAEANCKSIHRFKPL